MIPEYKRGFIYIGIAFLLFFVDSYINISGKEIIPFALWFFGIVELIYGLLLSKNKVNMTIFKTYNYLIPNKDKIKMTAICSTVLVLIMMAIDYGTGLLILDDINAPQQGSGQQLVELFSGGGNFIYFDGYILFFELLFFIFYLGYPLVSKISNSKTAMKVLIAALLVITITTTVFAVNLKLNIGDMAQGLALMGEGRNQSNEAKIAQGVEICNEGNRYVPFSFSDVAPVVCKTTQLGFALSDARNKAKKEGRQLTEDDFKEVYAICDDAVVTLGIDSKYGMSIESGCDSIKLRNEYHFKYEIPRINLAKKLINENRTATKEEINQLVNLCISTNEQTIYRNIYQIDPTHFQIQEMEKQCTIEGQEINEDVTILMDGRDAHPEINDAYFENLQEEYGVGTS